MEMTQALFMDATCYESYNRFPTVEIIDGKKKLIGYFCDIHMMILEPYKNYFWDFYNPLKQNVKDKTMSYRL